MGMFVNPNNSAFQVAFIPNEEIRQEFIVATKKRKWNELLNFQKKSEELLEATLDMDSEYDKKSKKNECMIEKYMVEKMS